MVTVPSDDSGRTVSPTGAAVVAARRTATAALLGRAFGDAVRTVTSGDRWRTYRVSRGMSPRG